MHPYSRAPAVAAALVAGAGLLAGCAVALGGAAPTRVALPTPTVSVGTPGDAATVLPDPVVSATDTHRPSHLTVLSLGDSVPAGAGCGCSPYGARVAAGIGVARQLPVTSLNDAVSGLTSAGLLAQLAPGQAAARDAAAADVVLVMIGANDVSPTQNGVAGCGSGLPCYTATVAGVRANLARILDRLRALHPAAGQQVVLLDYWNVWEDGSVGSDQGPEFVALARTVTVAVNEAIATAAGTGGAAYVDLVGPFGGAIGAVADALLISDGDHPSSAGHQVIADAVIAQVPALVRG